MQKNSGMMIALVVAIFRLVPHLLAFRDWYFFIPSLPIHGHGFYHGFVQIEHPPDVMERVKSNNKSNKHWDKFSSLKMYYETTVKEEDRHDEQKKEHIVLIHGTALSSEFWFCENNTNLVDLFIQAGYDVTLVDLRGHGQSEKPVGTPYTVQLLGADVAQALNLIHPNHKQFHIYGLSIGFGVAMSISLDYPELCKSLSGSGFLFDRSRRDIAASIFSQRYVVKLLGVALLSKIGEWVLHVNEPGLTARACRHTTIEGYIHTSSAWLNFNVTDQLYRHNVPTLIMIPEKDALIGHTPALHRSELSLMPEGVGEIVEFAGYSHMMCCENGGAQKQFEAFQSFVHKRFPSTCSTTENLPK